LKIRGGWRSFEDQGKAASMVSGEVLNING